MTDRVYNFSAGPAVLPLPVLEKAQAELLALPGVGSSVMEISHRSKEFTDIIEKAEANFRKLLAIPENYQVLFLQGGAQMQFAMTAMNLLAGTGGSADYIVTGTWGKKAMGTAKTQGTVRAAFDASDTNFNRIPKADELDLDPAAKYVHITSNETIQGVQFPAEPYFGDAPVICDCSSDLLCRPMPVDKYGIIYACAQKNIGPAGVTVVIIRDELIEASNDGLAPMLSYKEMAAAKSLYNTPPTFAVYMVKLVTDLLISEHGNLAAMEELGKKKSSMLYDVIDSSDGFYIGHAEKACRSIMNVPFRMEDPEMDALFIKEAAEAGLTSLKGHRSVGGMRASIYNAMPVEGVEALKQFMIDFQAKHG